MEMMENTIRNGLFAFPSCYSKVKVCAASVPSGGSGTYSNTMRLVKKTILLAARPQDADLGLQTLEPSYSRSTYLTVHFQRSLEICDII